MRLSSVSQTTTFRLSLLYGLLFTVGTVALIVLVYLRTAAFLTQRVDRILKTEIAAESSLPPAALRAAVNSEVLINGRVTLCALFSPSGERITGNLQRLPRGLTPDGAPIEMRRGEQIPFSARLIAKRLASGEILVDGRDIGALREIRRITSVTLIWSGIVIIVAVLAAGFILGLGPLRRLEGLQEAGRDIAAGDLRRRMPVSGRGDELDMFAGVVNYMLGEVERLMAEVKTSTDTIAHDLRTPLTRARARLHRLEQSPSVSSSDIARVTTQLDEVLERFAAVLRISELETGARSAGFVDTDLRALVRQAGELYQPLAEDAHVQLSVEIAGSATASADPKLLFEVISNLLDNAIKFTGKGGLVRLKLDAARTGPRILVEDNGPGIPPQERTAVLQRFYRGDRDQPTPGSGLGLSIANAIVRLHRFHLELEDAQPGLRAIVDCRPRTN